MTLRICDECGAALDPGERCDCQKEQQDGMEVERLVLRCDQPPVIFENLEAVQQNLEVVVQEVSTLAQNDGNLKRVKEIRASMAKQFDALEQQRKAVKAEIMAPYEQMDAKYKEAISDPYKQTDAYLKAWVDSYQNSLKSACLSQLMDYFNELCQANGIDFLDFSRCGITVDMAMARQKEPKKAMEKIFTFVSSVRSEMDAIARMPNAEAVMAEYRRFPVLGEAVRTVQAQVDAQREAEIFLARQKEQRELEKRHKEELLAAAPEIIQEEPLVCVAFLATGSMDALKAMKKYALSLGITFQNIDMEEK